MPKKITTSIKDNKFLNFFFRNIQPLRPEDRSFLAEQGVEKDYPFVSLCGREVNFIRPAATPIVFHSLEGEKLLYGGDLLHPFRPDQLAISPVSGHLFHRFMPDSSSKLGSETNLSYGLIRSSLAVTLSEHIVHDDSSSSSDVLFYNQNNKMYSIACLPVGSEPGPWGMQAYREEE